MVSDSSTNTVLAHFYVFEGLDGAGTTTQAERLVSFLRERVDRVDLDREPTPGVIGTHVRDILAGRRAADHHSLALLFAADRREHMFDPESGVLARHEQGTHIVCDRYLPSSLAYQGVTCGFDRVVSFNGDIPVPLHLFFLEVPVSVCLSRLAGRSEREIFEHEAFLQKTLTAYDAALEHMATLGTTVHRLDGTRSVEEVHDDVCSLVR